MFLPGGTAWGTLPDVCYVKPIALKFKINPEIPILHVVNTILTNFQSKGGQGQILLRGYFCMLKNFQVYFSWEMGLNESFP